MILRGLLLSMLISFIVGVVIGGMIVMVRPSNKVNDDIIEGLVYVHNKDKTFIVKVIDVDAVNVCYARDEVYGRTYKAPIDVFERNFAIYEG